MCMLIPLKHFLWNVLIGNERATLKIEQFNIFNITCITFVKELTELVCITTLLISYLLFSYFNQLFVLKVIQLFILKSSLVVRASVHLYCAALYYMFVNKETRSCELPRPWTLKCLYHMFINVYGKCYTLHVFLFKLLFGLSFNRWVSPFSSFRIRAMNNDWI